jgi:hypothetical protein
MFNIQAKHSHTKPTPRPAAVSDDIVVARKSEAGLDSAKHSKYTKTDMEKLLVGYEVAPTTQWGRLKKNRHIRYVRADNKFVRGGFVQGVSRQNGKVILTIANGFNAAAPGYTRWSIGFDKIRTIYAKSGAVPDRNLPPEHDPLKLAEWMKKTTASIAAISRRLDNVEKNRR